MFRSEIRLWVALSAPLAGLLIALAVLLLLPNADRADAQTAPVRFLDGGLESSFPESIRFYTSFETDIEIIDVRVRFSTGPITTEQYDYLDLTERTETLVDGELLWRGEHVGALHAAGNDDRFRLRSTRRSGQRVRIRAVQSDHARLPI